jgi:hypothetical protein
LGLLKPQGTRQKRRMANDMDKAKEANIRQNFFILFIFFLRKKKKKEKRKKKKEKRKKKKKKREWCENQQIAWCRVPRFPLIL